MLEVEKAVDALIWKVGKLGLTKNVMDAIYCRVPPTIGFQDKVAGGHGLRAH